MKKCLFFLVLCGSLVFPLWADESDDLIAQMDSQMNFTDSIFKDLEREQLKLEAERQADLAQHIQSEKNRTEQRLAEQLAGLSGRLSGLPDIPKFQGRFESGLPSAESHSEGDRPQE